MVDAVNVTHDIVLNSIGYRTTPGSINIVRATPFTQRLAQGKPTHSDLDNWDVISMQDWTHGLGQEGGGEQEPDLQMYYEASGVETSNPGEITLATKIVDSDAAFVARCFCDGGNTYVFSGGDAKIRYYDPVGNAWADALTTLPAAVVDLLEYKGTLYATLGDAQDMRKCVAPGTAPTTWVTMTNDKRSHLTIYKDKLWASNGNSIYSYDGTTWGAAKVCGDTAVPITHLYPSANYLIVCKEDRVMLYDDIGDKVYETGLIVPRHSNNFKRAILWNGMLWYGQLGQVNQAGGLGGAVSINPKTPQFFGSDARRQYGYGMPVGMTQNIDRLFVIFDKAENSYPVVLKHTGLGWHPVYRGSAGATAYAVYYSELTDRLWISDGTVRYQKYLSNGMPYPDYPTTGTQFITLSIDSAGFDEIPKAYRSLSVVAENLVVAHQRILLQWQKDKRGWWDNMASYCDVSPQQEVNFSGAQAAVSGKLMQIKLIPSTDNAALTPRIKVLTTKRIVRSPTLFVITAQIIIADYLELLDGSDHDTRTAQQLIQALMQASDAVEPITLDTPDGWRHQGILTNLSFHEELKREDT